MCQVRGVGVWFFISILSMTVGISPVRADVFSRSQVRSVEETGIADLPLAARFRISRVLGHNLTDYHAKVAPGGYGFANATQALSARFTEGGLEVHGTTAGFRLALVGWGYGEATVGPAPTAPRAEGNRVEYSRGALTEWYVNGPLGLQQGFTVQRRPEAGSGGPLTLALTLTTAGSAHPAADLRASLDPDAQGVTLSEPHDGGKWRYSGLHAYDATGRELPARMEAGDGLLRLRVDDGGAVYPVVVDPFIQQAKLTASDAGAADGFGWAVAISGNTVVIGAPYQESLGSAYVFERPVGGWGDMTETAKLTASDADPGAETFGYSVAISGATVVVGNSADDFGRGSAYVFERPAGGWVDVTETAKLTASDGVSYGDLFGYSVAISGDTVVIGAHNDDSMRGSAYVFERPAGGWVDMTETAKLTASNGQAFDMFGWSVAVDGKTAVVGAYTANSVRGAAYVFERPLGGWVDTTETAKLTASDGEPGGDMFGCSVGISDNTVVVGAMEDDIGANTDQGSAYVFERPAGGWVDMTETAKLTASNGQAIDMLGWSVAVSGQTAVVGAYTPNGIRSAAYAFERPLGGWADMTETAKLTAAEGEEAGMTRGEFVAISGTTVVVGAIGEGSAYVFGAASDQGATRGHILDQSQTVTTGYGEVGDGGEPRLGQVFTAGLYGILDQVSVELANSTRSPATGPVQVIIQTLTDDGLPSGIEIGRGTVPLSAIPPAGSPAWLEVSISPAKVTTGTQYALLLSTEGGMVNWYMYTTSEPDLYPDGYRVVKPLDTWVEVFDNTDAGFETYVWPSTIDQSQTASNRNNLFGSGQRLGQTFTAGLYGMLGQVSVELENYSTDPATGPVHVSIQTLTASGLPSGIEVGSGTIPLGAIPPAGSRAWVDVGVSDVYVTPGTQYALVLSLSGDGYVRWADNNDGSSYPGGAEVIGYASGGWTTLSSYDTAFETYLMPSTLDQSYTVSHFVEFFYGNFALAQTFTAGLTGILDRVGLCLGNLTPSPATGQVFVSIQTLTNAGLPSGAEIGTGTIPLDAIPSIQTLTNAGLPSGAEIGTGTIPLDAIPSAGACTWVDVGISGPYLTAGTRYAIALSMSDPGEVAWEGGYNEYPGGGSFFWDGGDWATGSEDMSFKTYVIPAAMPGTPPPQSPLPLPSTPPTWRDTVLHELLLRSNPNPQ